MKEFFTYNGISSADFGCYVASSNQFDAPARDVESIEIPGRNGALTIDNGRYLNQTLTYSMYVRNDIRTKIMGFRNALAKNRGYQRLEDSYNPTEFYLARYIDGFEVKQSDRYGAGFSVTFDRKPQRFLKSGDLTFGVDAYSFTADGSILNETDQIAKPLLRVYGTGTFTINGSSMTISSANSYTDIDCELMDAYKGTTNCNGNISGSFPTLSPGDNTIDLPASGISKIEIIPRWWRL